MCEEFDCPKGCSGRHDSSDIDCGPDAVFEDLAEHGVVVEHPGTAPIRSRWRTLPPDPAQGRPVPEMAEQFTAALEHFGIDPTDTEVLISAAAVGLVADTWRDGPLDAIHAAAAGPSDGEILAQSIDLYRTAREALTAARTDGPEALLAFQAVAADLQLPWAGGSSFTLRGCGEPTEEFVQHLDDRVWFTSKLIREQGWQAGLLHRAASAALKAPTHFGMERWPDRVTEALARLTAVDRSGAPEALADLAAVEAALLEAPDRLGVAALDWLCVRGVLE